MFAPAGQTTAQACLLANCRRSLCADKRPARGLPAGGRLPYICGPQMCGSYRTVTIPLQIAHKSNKLSPKTMHSVENPLNKRYFRHNVKISQKNFIKMPKNTCNAGKRVL